MVKEHRGRAEGLSTTVELVLRLVNCIRGLGRKHLVQIFSDPQKPGEYVYCVTEIIEDD